MRRRNFVSQVAIRFGLELIHYDAQHSPAFFPRAPAGAFHHTQVTAGADGVTGRSQQLARTMRLRVLGICWHTTRPAKDRDNTFLCLAHDIAREGVLPIIINDPAARYSR